MARIVIELDVGDASTDEIRLVAELLSRLAEARRKRIEEAVGVP